MAPIDDDTLDRLLTRHLSAQLNGQLGRAEAAFRQRLTDVAPLRLVHDSEIERAITMPSVVPSAPVRTTDRSFWQRPAGWLVSVASTAVAASLLTAMLLPKTSLPTESNSQSTNQVVSTKPNDAVPQHGGPSTDQPAIRYVHDRAWDEGTVSPGNANTVLRQIRREQLERVRYFDHGLGQWVEVVIPREDVRHYVLDTY